MTTFSILDAAAEEPEAPAWIDDDGTLSHAALADGVRPLLGPLAALDAGSITSLLATPTRATLVRLLAAIEVGVPVALLHPRWTEHERRGAIETAGARIALEQLEPSGLLARRRPVPPDRPLALVFTSGTTGAPRAAILSHGALSAAARASAEVLGWETGDRWLLAMPLAHVGGLSIVLRCLSARRPVVLSRPDAIVSTIERHQVSLLSVVPTQLERLIERPAPPSLRRVLVGGAACPEPLRRRALERGWPVRTTYGLTEMCAQVATQRTSDDRGVGPLLPGVELEIRDERVFVRGPSLFSGFAGAPSPFDDRGFYDTGDFGRLDQGGHLHLLGRRSDLIVTGGENVYPREVELVLERVPGVEAACVFGVPDPQWGAVVAAALVGAASETELASHLDRYLARYKQPRLVAWREALALSGTGKLDRAATAAEAAAHLHPLPRPR